jgi:hypothetical protein
MALRDDDRDVLIAAHDRLGLGHLAASPARRNSRPQVHWSITSKLECKILCDLLDAHPLRARKLREYEIWREAVKVWSFRRYGLAPGAQSRLAKLAAGIRNARVYREPARVAIGPALTDAFARQYFAGFFSGEGCFSLGRRNARFAVKLRRDDRPLLESFRRDFRIGNVCDVETPEPWSPGAVWHVTGARDVLRGIAIFDSAGLLGRKGRQFRAWRPGAEAVALAKIARVPANERIIEESHRALAHATEYRPPRSPLGRGDPAPAARAAYIEVLRAWAEFAEGPLTCTAYQAVRRRSRPHWPKRETIGAEFGGWCQALHAAGLGDRAFVRSARQLGV